MSNTFQPKGERGSEYYNVELFDPTQMELGELGMDEWRTSWAWLVTRGVATCIALAATNTAERTALLGHFTGPGEDRYDPEPELLFERAVAELPNLGPPEHTRIYLAGARILPSDVDTSKEDRTRAYSEMCVRKAAEAASIPPSAIRVEWLHDYLGLDASVNPSSGEITIICEDPFNPPQA